MICHCTDCQTLAGSAFRTVVPTETPEAEPVAARPVAIPSDAPRHAVEEPSPTDEPEAGEDFADWDEPEPVAGITPWRRLRRAVNRDWRTS